MLEELIKEKFRRIDKKRLKELIKEKVRRIDKRNDQKN